MSKRPHTDSAVGDGDEPSDCVEKLVQDITEFSETSEYPRKLASHLYKLDDDDIATWYKELNKAYKARSKPLQKPEEATLFVFRTLDDAYPFGVDLFELEGFLEYYGLPLFGTIQIERSESDVATSEKRELEKRHKFLMVLKTLPVEQEQVTYGGGLNVSVEVKGFFYLPSDLLFWITARNDAWAKGEDSRANELLNKINATKEYKWNNDMEFPTKMYEIRLRGIDVPGIETHDGIKARDTLANMVIGKCLEIEVHHLDDNKRCVGDVYCEGILVQDWLLENGVGVRHQDPELAEWEKDASLEMEVV